jgi:hypothetical protein
MPTVFYGIDIEKPVTPLMVRDALVECFFEAHCKETGLEGADDKTSKSYCQEAVKKAFTDSNGNFDTPDKASLIKAMEQLAELSKNFRNQETIQRHFSEMMTLVSLLS